VHAERANLFWDPGRSITDESSAWRFRATSLPPRTKPSGKKLAGAEWADMNAMGSRILGGTDTIAQVHPKKLCETPCGSFPRVSGNGSICGVKLEDGTNMDAQMHWLHLAGLGLILQGRGLGQRKREYLE